MFSKHTACGKMQIIEMRVGMYYVCRGNINIPGLIMSFFIVHIKNSLN